MTTTTPIILRVSPEAFFEISRIEKFNDGSGYTSLLSVGSGRFLCSGNPFEFDNLKEFIANINQAYERIMGKARLGCAFEEDFVEVEMLSGGHVIVTGCIIQHGPPQQELRFEFECDQTFLPQLLRSLNQVGKDLEREA